MLYKLKIGNRARKDIQSLDYVVQKRIAKKLKFFAEQDDPIKFAKKPTDNKDGDYRCRVGHFRVIFDVKAQSIIILRVQHRKDVYKDK